MLAAGQPIMAQSKSPDDAKIRDQVAVLADANRPVDERIHAAMWLGQSKGDPKIVAPALIKGLSDPIANVRRLSAYGMGMYGPNIGTEAAGALFKATSDPDPEVATQAKSSITGWNAGGVGVGVAALPAIRDALDAHDGAAISCAVQVVAGMGQENVKPLLPRMLVAFELADALSRLAIVSWGPWYDDPLPIALKASLDSDPMVKMAGVGQLQTLGREPAKAVELDSKLNASDSATQIVVATVLAYEAMTVSSEDQSKELQVAESHALTVLIHLFSDPALTHDQVNLVSNGLLNLNDRSIAPLSKLLDSAPEAIQLRVINTLTNLPNGGPILEEATKSSNPKISKAAKASLDYRKRPRYLSPPPDSPDPF
jgi:hypothetical protein